MTLADRTLAFAEQAPGLQTRKALSAGLMSLIEPIGASRFSCLYLRRDAGGVIIERSISNVPRLWQELYFERGYEATDPVFKSTVRGGAYGYWNELTRAVTLGKAGREVMDVASEFNMKDGFTRRVSLDSGGLAVMMVAGEELDHSERTKAALRMVFDVFANEGVRMLKLANGEAVERDESRRSLSKTQLKVLLLRAEGHSNKLVAQQLGRNEKTVECHVTEILRRLDARNMIDAIRIATKLRMIA